MTFILKVIFTSILVLLSTTNINSSELAKDPDPEDPLIYEQVDGVDSENSVENLLIDINELISYGSQVNSTDCSNISTTIIDTELEYWIAMNTCQGICLGPYCCYVTIEPKRPNDEAIEN